MDPATPDPGEGPLHDPSPFDHLESLGPLRAAAHLDHVPAMLGEPGIQGVIAVLVIRPELLQPGECPLGQLPQHLRRRGPVVRRGGGDGHRQDQPQRVHDDVPLAAVEPLATIESVRAADLGGLDGLAVDAPGRGGRLAAGPAADLGAEGVVEGRPGAVVSPLDEVVVDGPPLGEVMGQGPPGAAVSVAVEGVLPAGVQKVIGPVPDRAVGPRALKNPRRRPVNSRREWEQAVPVEGR